MRKHANRTFLFAPGNHPRRVEKALQLEADVVILDLEDAVAESEKVATRQTVRAALQQPRAGACYVRVNAYETPFCYQDLRSTICPELDGFVLPKVEDAQMLQTVDWLIANLEREHGLPEGAIGLMPIIETAKGLANLRAIAAAGTRVRRLSFGAGDFTRDLSLDWSLSEEELLTYRAEFVLASRLGGLEPPVDTVFIHIREHEAFAQSCRMARQLGFQGKLCIHPDQVGPVNRTFTPTADEVAWSQRVIEAFDKAEAAGDASIQVDGYFVDYPIVEKARRVVATANLINETARAA